jgi:hypothetical protein
MDDSIKNRRVTDLKFWLRQTAAFCQPNKLDRRPKPCDSTLKDTPNKSEDRKSELRPGSLTVDTDKPTFEHLPQQSQLFIEKALKIYRQGIQDDAQAQTEEKHRKNINTQIENVQKLSGALSDIWKDIVKEAQDHFEYIPYPRKDFQGFNKDAYDRAHKENYKYRLMNEALAWVAQHIIEKNHPFSFRDAKEFSELRELMLNQRSSKDEIQNIKGLQKALASIGIKDEKLKNFWQHSRERIVNQITKANQRLKEYEEKSKKHEEMLKERKEYTGATIHDEYSRAKERAKQAQDRAKLSTHKYTVDAENFAKELDWIPVLSEERMKQGNELIKQATQLAEKIVKDLEKIRPDSHFSEQAKRIKRDVDTYLKPPASPNGLSAAALRDHLNATKKTLESISGSLSIMRNAVPPSSSSATEHNKVDYDKLIADKLSKNITNLQREIQSFIDNNGDLDKKELFFDQKDIWKEVDKDGLNRQDIAKKVEGLGREIVDLENKIARIAESAATKAKARVQDIQKKVEGSSTRDTYKDYELDSIRKEQEDWKLEYTLVEKAQKKQEELIRDLNLFLLKDLDDTSNGGSASSNSSFTSEDEIDRIQFSQDIKDLIEKAEKRLKKLEERKTNYQRIEKYYYTVPPKSIPNTDSIWHEDKEIMKERAKNLAEQYREREKKTYDRIKEYEEQLKPLIEYKNQGDVNRKANPALTHIENALTNAKEIAKLEQKIARKYSTLANNIKDISNVEKLQNIEENIKNDLSGINTEYKNELQHIQQAKQKEDELAKLARTDQEALQELCKWFENPASFSEKQPNNIIKQAKDALDNNLHYIDYKTKENEKRIQDLFKELNKTLMAKDVEDIQALSKAHIVMDNVDKGCASINGVYMELKEIRSIDYDKETGNAIITFREDITEIFVDGEKPYKKRLAEYGVASNSSSFSVEIPGIGYDRRPGDERSKLILNINGKKEELSVKTLKRLVFKKHEKEKGDIEWSIEKQLKTMPDEQHPYDKTISPEKLKDTYRINLENMTCIVPDGQFAVPLKMLDFTETTVDPENGISFRIDKQWRLIPLKYLGNLNTFVNPMKELQAKASDLAITLKNESLDFLQEAHRTDDPTKIAEAFALIDSTQADLATDKAGLLAPLGRVPKDEHELAKLRMQALDQLQREILYNSKNAKEVVNAYNNLNRSLIVDGLLTTEFQAEFEKIKNDAIDENTQRELQEKLTKIYNDFHLNIDSLLADANEDEKEKFKHHNALTLVKEYERYMSRIKDLSEEEKEYVKDIERFVDRKGDVYLNNEICLIKANSTTDLNEILDALKKLDKVNYIENPETLKGRRQTYENIMVDHLQRAVNRANKESNPGLIWSSLRQAMILRQHRLNTLEYVKEALTSTSKDDILKNIKKITEQPSFKVSELGDEFYDKKLNNIEAEVDHLIKDIGLKAQNPAEYAKRSTELIYKTATLAYQQLVDAFKHDPEALRDLDANKVAIIQKMADQALAANNIILRLGFFDQQKHLMFVSMIWDIMGSMVSQGPGLKEFKGRIGQVFLRLISELLDMTPIKF